MDGYLKASGVVALLVGSFMRAQGAQPAEALAAKCALVRLFAGVDALMGAQVVLAGVELAACIAWQEGVCRAASATGGRVARSRSGGLSVAWGVARAAWRRGGGLGDVAGAAGGTGATGTFGDAGGGDLGYIEKWGARWARGTGRGRRDLFALGLLVGARGLEVQ